MIRAVLLSAAPSPPPREFRIFRAGANPSTKGTFQFGPAEAAAVISAWRAEGSHRLPIDVEHDSLDPAARQARADAGDAVGWFTPEVRSGELWATQVEFGPVGLERLARKSQTYFSPAFSADKNGNVQALVNVALVSMPALHALDQLVAAGKYGRASSTTVHARVTHSTAEVFRGMAKRAGLAPGVMIRRCLVALAAAPSDTAAAGLDTIRKALGLEPDAGRAEIVDALDALYTLIGGDPADAPPVDPLAAAPDAPPAKLNRGQVAVLKRAGLPVTLEGWATLAYAASAGLGASKPLTPEQIAALKKRKLPVTQAAWMALAKSMVRRGGEERVRPAAQVAALSKSEVAQQVAALPQHIRRAALAKFGTLEDFVVARAKATHRRT